MLEGLVSMITDMFYLCFQDLSLETNLFQLSFCLLFVIGICRLVLSLIKYKYY